MKLQKSYPGLSRDHRLEHRTLLRWSPRPVQPGGRPKVPRHAPDAPLGTPGAPRGTLEYTRCTPGDPDAPRHVRVPPGVCRLHRGLRRSRPCSGGHLLYQRPQMVVRYTCDADDWFAWYPTILRSLSRVAPTRWRESSRRPYSSRCKHRTHRERRGGILS